MVNVAHVLVFGMLTMLRSVHLAVGRAPGCGACTWLWGVHLAAERASGCGACTWLRSVHLAVGVHLACITCVLELHQVLSTPYITDALCDE